MGKAALFLAERIRNTEMKAAFLGDGSLRLLPILRGVFAKKPEVFRNGEIPLNDRKNRTERLVAACPEYRNVE